MKNEYKMKIIKWLSAISLWIICFNIYGQKIRKIPHKSKKNNDSIYIVCNVIDSLNKVNVHLLNRTKSKVTIYYGGRSIEFVMQAKDRYGEWRQIEDTFIDCPVGIENLVIPSNFYASQSIEKSTFEGGDFETEVRFTVRIEDTILVASNPVKSKIDYNWFLLPHARRLKRIERILADKDSSIEEKNKSTFRKALIYFKIGDYPNVVALMEEILLRDKNDYRAKFFLGYVLVKELSYAKDLPKPEKIEIINRAMNEWKSIPSSYRNYEAVVNSIEKYTEEMKKYE